MNNGAFTPFGPTYLIGTSEVQVLPSDNNSPTAVRIRNLKATTQYISWKPALPTGGSVSITVTAPTAGVPSVNTISLLPNSVEVIGISGIAWFKADAAAAFEVTPGEGL